MDLFSVLAFIAMCQLLLVESALPPLSNPVSIGYYSLMEDLLKHPAVQFKIPPSPVVTTSFNSSHHKPETVVEIELFPTNILELNGNQEVMVMTAYLQLTWNHPDLIWNSSEYEGISLVEFQASQIWTPSLTVMSEVEDKTIALDESVNLSINHTGVITVALDKHFKTYCKMDFTYFPLDEQICDYILSASWTPITLNYLKNNSASFIKQYSQGGEWNITDMYWEASYSSDYKRSTLRSCVCVKTLDILLFNNINWTNVCVCSHEQSGVYYST
ncbi:LOW QUALITY PROTEIN: acetylcholine receptor subunit beta-type acr-2-like [Pomacea canaliculata]|uniref:LOW QUALITY PROTEIN: acetylcholine receptor subunit beta-type acr-2-like n=1 Tax=Pomacea canaliculata TaxID=400727 RepID=UPI000D73C3F4|nr:LOW QUALITY PROTEIN: acetylcholine receptor subunit beta-type acr-2-like [Pomacea canaliculata]